MRCGMKVFISQPMRGYKKEAVEELREKIKKSVIRKYGKDVDFLIAFRSAPSEEIKPLAALGVSISVMSSADLVVFAPNWSDARGCMIERECCRLYGIKTIEAGYTGDGEIKINYEEE